MLSIELARERRQTRLSIAFTLFSMHSAFSRLLLILACSLAVQACADHGGSPVDQVTHLCAGSWQSAPLLRGPGAPPRGFERLELSIAEVMPAEASTSGAPAVRARGTVTWNGTSWPMQLELGAEFTPYCRYAPGHPFTGGADHDGFSFRILIADAPFESLRSTDELYVDHRNVGCTSPATALEPAWFKYTRSGP